MGKFANVDPESMVGARILPAPELEGSDGFAALGETVPAFRKSAAERTLREIGLTDSEAIYDCVAQMANKIERDEPHAALEIAIKYVDITGCYRLLAVLLCSEDKTPAELGADI